MRLLLRSLRLPPRSAGLAGGARRKARPGPPMRPAPPDPRPVVELFTSQGCSSCPAADALLGQLAKRDDVIALSFSVDYWDYLGWKDTLANPKFTERQRAYAKARGDGAIYTPQVIVNGVAHVNGSDESQDRSRRSTRPARRSLPRACRSSFPRRTASSSSRPAQRRAAAPRQGSHAVAGGDRQERDVPSSAARTRARPSPTTMWCAS